MDTWLVARFEHGMSAAEGGRADIDAVPRNRHKDFEVVYLKNIITAKKSVGYFTCIGTHLTGREKTG